MCQTICDVTSSNFLGGLVQCEQKRWDRGFHMSIANDIYHVHTYERTNVPTSPALWCWDKNPRHYPKIVMPKVTYNSHTYNRFLQYKFLMATPTSHAYSHLVSLCPQPLGPCLLLINIYRASWWARTTMCTMSSWMVTACSGHFPISSMAVTNTTFKSEACCTSDGHSHTHRSNS